MTMRKTIIRSVFAGLATVIIASCCGGNTATSNENDAIKNIMSRKSVRSFTDEKITDEQMDIMLKAAMAAPSGMNLQPWSFVVLTDTSRYDKVFAGNFNMKVFKDAAAVVVFCADTTQAVRGTEERVPNTLWRDDLGACTENFLLAAESLGLGAVWTACYPIADRMGTVKTCLNLPAEVLPYSIVAVGHPDTENMPKDKYDASRIHIEHW